jgi:hypothetical protein
MKFTTHGLKYHKQRNISFKFRSTEKRDSVKFPSFFNLKFPFQYRGFFSRNDTEGKTK